jgi:hypothetical protein
MRILQEFKDFINRGNVVDLAVGVAVGAAFGRVVTSLVEDIIMPPIGRILSDLDFSNLYLPLSAKVPYGLGAQGRPLHRRTHSRLWELPHRGAELPDRRLLHLPRGEGDEYLEAARSGRSG